MRTALCGLVGIGLFIGACDDPAELELVTGELYAQPPITTRAEWGARAPQCAISQCTSWDHITLHHSAVVADQEVTDHSQCAARVRAHQNYHMDTNGWCDLGYNFLVCTHGVIFEGREGSLASYPRGAHDSVNCNGLGICAMGDYTSVDPSSALIDAVTDLMAWQWDANGRTPFGTGLYGGVTENIVGGHRNITATACPGDSYYANFIGDDPATGTMRTETCTKQDLCSTDPAPFVITEVAQKTNYGGSTADKVELLCVAAGGCGGYRVCDGPQNFSSKSCTTNQAALTQGQRVVVARGTSIATSDHVWIEDTAGVYVANTQVGTFNCSNGKSRARLDCQTATFGSCGTPNLGASSGSCP